jgi:hypothetical protein
MHDPTSPPAATPARDDALAHPSAAALPARVAAVATGQSVITDLADLITSPDPGEAGARIAVRLAEETAELAAMIRALPGRPPDLPGHSHAAIEAITTAGQQEHDFAGWLADVLCRVAARLGSTEALIAGRPGLWEASLVYQLVAGTVGENDELLPGYGAGEYTP